MKHKYAKKVIKGMYDKIYMLPSSDIFDLGYESAFGYSTRAEGWACDYYEVEGVCFCYGYAPIGDKVDSKLYNSYVHKMQKNQRANWLSYNRRKSIATRLLRNFVNKLALL